MIKVSWGLKLVERGSALNSDKREKVGIELLRIIAMLTIIAWHYGVYSGFSYEEYHPNVLLLNAICGGSTGNAIFIMITGFFLGSKSKPVDIKISKMAKLLVLASFYSILFFVVMGDHSFSGFSDTIRTIREVLFPYVYGDYWFIAGYVLVYALCPFTNMLINAMSKEQYKKLMWIMIIITVAFPSLIGATESFSNILEMFILYYLIGAYIGKYKVYDEIPVWKTVIVLMLSIVARIALIYSYYHFSNMLGFIAWNDLLRRMKNSYYLFNILIATMFLLIFAKVHIKNKVAKKLITMVSATTLGVYLIHENPIFRPFWWELLRGIDYERSTMLPVHCLGSVLLTFFVCMAFEIVRRAIVKPIIRICRL